MMKAKHYAIQQARALPSEHIKQRRLFDWANNPHVQKKYPELEFMYSVPNGGKRDKIAGARLKAEGVKAGVYDVHLDSPRGGYSGLRIEMKHGKNGLTANQKRYKHYWEGEGFIVVECWSHIEAIETITAYLEKTV